MSVPGAASVEKKTAAFTIILPGSWVTVPMGDRDTMRTAVSRIVKSRVPKDDRLATLRQQARQELLTTAERAAATGAELFALSMEIIPGVPFPASLIATEQDWPAHAPASLDPIARLSRVIDEASAIDAPLVPTVRSRSLVTRTVETEAVPTLKLQYGCAALDGRVVAILISVPNVPDDEGFVELLVDLFDAMVCSIRWASPNGEEAE